MANGFEQDKAAKTQTDSLLAVAATPHRITLLQRSSQVSCSAQPRSVAGSRELDSLADHFRVARSHWASAHFALRRRTATTPTVRVRLSMSRLPEQPRAAWHPKPVCEYAPQPGFLPSRPRFPRAPHPNADAVEASGHDTHVRWLGVWGSLLNSSRDASAQNNVHVVRQSFQADGQPGKPNVLGHYFVGGRTIQCEISQCIRYQSTTIGHACHGILFVASSRVASHTRPASPAGTGRTDQLRSARRSLPVARGRNGHCRSRWSNLRTSGSA